MARTPFFARVQPAAMGATSYTVPAGKFAVCNIFQILESTLSSDNPLAPPSAHYVQSSGAVIMLNGIQVMKLWLGTGGTTFGRKGPVVFNAGDVISHGGMGASDVYTPPCAFGLVGFLYDQSSRKVPLNQKLITGTTSYTVPAGKHIVANFFPGSREDLGGGGSGQYQIMINSTVIIKVGGYAPGQFAADYGFGPITAGSGSVVSIAVILLATPAQNGLLSGFLYNN